MSSTQSPPLNNAVTRSPSNPHLKSEESYRSSISNALQLCLFPRESSPTDAQPFPFFEPHCPYGNTTCRQDYLYHRSRYIDHLGLAPHIRFKEYWCLSCDGRCFKQEIPSHVMRQSPLGEDLTVADGFVESPEELESLEIIPLGQSRRARSLGPKRLAVRVSHFVGTDRSLIPTTLSYQA